MLAFRVTSRSFLLSALVLAAVTACGADPNNNPGGAGTNSVAGTPGGGSAGAISGSAGQMSAGTAGAIAGGGAGGATAGGGAGGSGGMVDPMPTMLSQTGLYSDIASKKLADGVHPFQPA